MENKMTPQQRQAAENHGGKLLVSAAAGSGKTMVLVERLIGFILDENKPCNIDEFLIITYTKAAAAELRGKIATRLSEYLAEQPENHHLQRQMQRLYLAKISTVHAFCSDLLREYAHDLNLPADFRVADENECRQLREQVMTELLENAYTNGLDDPDFRAFIDTQGLGKDDRLVPDILLKVYDSARCHLDPEQWMDHCLDSVDLEHVQDAAQTVWGAYLMEDLKQYLRLQIHAMKGCVRLAQADPLMENPEQKLRQTVAALEYLEQSQTWDDILQRKDIDYGRLVFSKKISDLDAAEKIKSVREGCKKGLEKRLKIFCDPSEQVLADLQQTGSAVRGLIALARQFGKHYSALKQRRRLLDFGDLEHKTLDLLLGKNRNAPTQIAREVGRRFAEVLVDEYQDSNAVQDAIFTALTAEKQNCFMVGDVKQSIYQFRLADPGIFLEKYNSYAAASDAVDGQGRKVMLSRNFRSGGAVLEATNDVCYRCMSRKVGGLDYGPDEALVEGVPHEPLGDAEVELHVLKTQEDAYTEEAEFVADRIVRLLAGDQMIRGKEGLRPIEPEDIVILLRSPGSVGQEFQDALSRRGIRSSFGSGRDLLQTGEISVLRALLEIISNPRQDIPQLAVMMSPIFAFTADDMARIRSLRKQGDVFDALLMDDTEQTKVFLKTLDRLREIARTSTLAGLLEEIFCMTRMDSIYAAMESGVEKTCNLRDFFQIAVGFERTARRDLGQFLEYLDMMEEKGLTAQDNTTGGAVGIMSIHKSKGLEYPVVFLSALARSFNKESLRANVLCDGELGLGLSAVDHTTRIRYPTIAKRAIVARTSQQSLSEELRVLYVAMTRAKDRLIMTYAAKTPEKELAAIARQMDLGGTELLASEVTCPGQWVLMEAMCRTEAGALFRMADARPSQTHLADYPWMIQVHEGAQAKISGQVQQEQPEETMAPEVVARLKKHLGYQYPFAEATITPSKQTATQLKGRQKDQEIAEQSAPQKPARNWREIAAGKTARGREYGTAMHALMQYVNFEKCRTVQDLGSEIDRLVQCRLLQPEQAERIDREAVLAFFATELGKRIANGKVLREFKFSILEDAALYGQGLSGEKILLQGVVDCALIEPDGITIIDFKTDHVTQGAADQMAERYRHQVMTYSAAMERIYEMPVQKRYLYLFHTRELVEV